MNLHILRSALIIIAATATISCSSTGVLPESPQVSAVDVEILEVGLDAQKFRITLSAYNPNKFALPLSGVEFDLDFSGIRVGSGLSTQDVSLEAVADTTFPVDVETNLAESMDGFQQKLLTGDLNLDYNLAGKLLVVGQSVGIPFLVSGNLLE